MRPLILLWSYAAFAVSAAAAKDGYLWTIDQSIVSSATAQINSDLASSIVARRRGQTDSRSLRTADDLTLREINTYGGWQQPLFGERAGEAPGKLFIRISGFDGAISELGAAMPDLWIDQPTKDLKTDFKADPSRGQGICEYVVPPSRNTPNSKDVEVIFTYPLGDETSCLSSSEILSIPVIMSVHSVLPTSAASMPTAIGSLTRILRHLSATQNVESTILLLPTKLSSPTHKHKELRRQDIPEETRLDLPSYPTLAPESYTSFASNTTNHTLPRNIPACFTSQSACTNTTNACSGHGECYFAHTNCYRCRCGTTVSRVNEDGSKKTVQWGGGACEKKDVSVPFLLFAGFGTAMFAVIAGAIGMLYSMGSQDLPSVLAAGVGGVGARGK